MGFVTDTMLLWLAISNECQPKGTWELTNPISSRMLGARAGILATPNTRYLSLPRAPGNESRPTADRTIPPFRRKISNPKVTTHRLILPIVDFDVKMASGPTTFTTLDVFTSQRYGGNQLAIVSVRANSLTKAQKHAIAKEFNYAETVFLHDAPSPDAPRRMEIFTCESELNLAGHPVIGTAVYIFKCLERFPKGRRAALSATLQTNAGLVQVHYNPVNQVGLAEFPHDFKLHKYSVSTEAVKTLQPVIPQALSLFGNSRRLAETSPVVSIVKGMTFVLTDLTAIPSLLPRLVKEAHPPQVQLDEGWTDSFVGHYFYCEIPEEAAAAGGPGIGAAAEGLKKMSLKEGESEGGEEKAAAGKSASSKPSFPEASSSSSAEPTIHRVRARMFSEGVEDAATGSAACTYAAWSSLQRGGAGKTHVFAIEQGVEMGRKSQICVEVKLDAKGTGLEVVRLSGQAVLCSEGKLFLD